MDRVGDGSPLGVPACLAEPLPAHATMPVMERVRRITLAIAERCATSGAPPSEEVTDRDCAALDPAERAVVLRVGLITLINDVAHLARRAVTQAPGTSRFAVLHGVHGRNPVAWRALGIVFHGADGRLKRLLDFGREDLALLKREAALQRDAWEGRGTWATQAEAALVRARAKTLAGLPQKALERLDAEALKVWRRVQEDGQ